MLNNIIKEELQQRTEEDIRDTISKVIESLQFIIKNPYIFKVDRLETAKSDIEGILDYYLIQGGGVKNDKLDFEKIRNA